QFQKKDGALEKKMILSKNSLAGEKIILIDSGTSKESTKDLVNEVKERKEKNPSKYETILSDMGSISQEIINSLHTEKFRFDLWRKSHRHFIELGVVGKKACQIVDLVESSGGHCKQSGAGGFETGSGILLAQHENASVLIDLAESEKWRYWEVTLGEG